MPFSSDMTEPLAGERGDRAPLIILCPPRSFSSVVCGMLGQHPQLYGLPEVNLFTADRLAGVLEAHRTRPHGLHGLLRALAQLHEGIQHEDSVERAREWVERRKHWSSRQVFDHICELTHPRIPVDKSPRTVMRTEFMQRAAKIFADASYLHLTRHPRSTCVSTLSLLERNEEWGGTAKAGRIDPERIWYSAHQNIMNFSNKLREGQSMRLKGEVLLSDPMCFLPQIAEWLGLRKDAQAIEAMLQPEQSPFACFGPDNAKYGNDPNYLNDPVLRLVKVREPNLDEPLEWAQDRSFLPATRKLAKLFGYR